MSIACIQYLILEQWSGARSQLKKGNWRISSNTLPTNEKDSQDWLKWQVQLINISEM